MNWDKILSNWRFTLVFVAPILLFPVCIIPDIKETKKFECLYVIILTALLWMTESIPLAVTSFLPVVMFPLLGVLDTGRVSLNYMKETNMMFVAGLIIALAVEYSKLHHRIALSVMILVGVSPFRLMLGIMLNTMFLSMWISNTATTAMMVPIVLAVMDELSREPPKNSFSAVSISKLDRNSNTDSGGKSVDTGSMVVTFQQSNGQMTVNSVNRRTDFEENAGSTSTIAVNDSSSDTDTLSSGMGYVCQKEAIDIDMVAISMGIMVAANIGGTAWPYSSLSSAILYRIATEKPIGPGILQMYGMLFSCNFSANLGGTATPFGSGPNLILMEMAFFIGQNGKYTDLTFASWMAYAIPPMIVTVLISWLYLAIIYFKLGRKKGSTKGIMCKENQKRAERMLEEKYKSLGPMTFHEKAVAALFFVAVSLWFFREPGFMPGWAGLISTDANFKIGDSTPAMFVVLLLFIIPKDPKAFFGNDPNAKFEALLDWKYVQKHMPWHVVLLMGGGFALSDGANRSGLSLWLGEQLAGLKELPNPVILLIVMILTALLTEVASNTACANVLIPILFTLSRNLNLHPLYLTLPATITCSYAFMLPVATPSNAIVFSAGKMKIMDMVKTGSVLNVTCVITLFLFNITYGNYLFDYDNYIYPNATINSNETLS